MKKLRLLLALLVASIGSVQGAWARTAPTLPEAQTLVVGNVYFLYNIGSDRFLTYSNDNNYYANAQEITSDHGDIASLELLRSAYKISDEYTTYGSNCVYE